MGLDPGWTGSGDDRNGPNRRVRSRLYVARRARPMPISTEGADSRQPGRSRSGLDCTRSMQSLFDAVRESASRQAWSRGVELARANAVTAERIDAREAQLRVAVPGAPVARLVTLLLDADAWSCECPGPEDPCEHVAAAVIALRRAREEGRELPSPQESGAGALHYELRRVPGGLALDRFVVLRRRARAARREPARPRDGPRRRSAHRRERSRSRRRRRDPGHQRPHALARLAAARAAGARGVRARDARRRAGARLARARRARSAPRRPRRRLPADGRAAARRDRVARRRRRALRRRDPPAARDAPRRPRARRVSARQAVSAPATPRSSRARSCPTSRAASPWTCRRRGCRAPRAASRRARASRRRATATRWWCAPTSSTAIRRPRASCSGRLVAVQGVVPIRDEAAERAAARRIQSRARAADRRPKCRCAARRRSRWRRDSSASRGTVAGDAQRAFFRAPPLTAHFEATPDGFELWFESGDGDAKRARRVDGADGDARVVERANRSCCCPAAASRRCPPTGSRASAARSPTCSTRATPRARCRAPRCPTSRSSATRSSVAAARARRVARGARRRLRRHPARGAARRSRRDAAPLPADRRRLARVPARRRPRRAARRRHGPRQDAAGALRAAHGERALVVAPTSVLFNWEDEIARFRPALTRRALPRRRARARSRRGRDAHHLRAAAPRRRGARRERVGHRRARRGAGDQEPRQPGGARRVRAARRSCASR